LAHRAIRVLLGRKVSKVYRVSKVILVTLALKDQQARRAIPALRVSKVYRVYKALKVQMAHKVFRVRQQLGCPETPFRIVP